MRLNEKTNNIIVFRNVEQFITSEERQQLKAQLSKENLEINFFENHRLQASIFDGIFLYINQNLTELIATGLLTPMIYDLIKSSVLFVFKRICKSFHVVTAEGSQKVKPSIQLECGNAGIIAIIPDNLSNDQFCAYMDLLKQTLSDFNESKFKHLLKHQSFIAEYNADSDCIKVETITEYGCEQMAKQNERENLARSKSK